MLPAKARVGRQAKFPTAVCENCFTLPMLLHGEANRPLFPLFPYKAIKTFVMFMIGLF